MKRSLFAASLLSLALAPASVAAPVARNAGAITNVYTIVASDDDFAPLTETFVRVAHRLVNVPAGGATIIATFTAECGLFGSTDTLANWVEVEIRDGNRKLLPTGGSSPVAFCSANNSSGSHSVQAVSTLAPGVHIIRVMAKISRSNSDTLSASLDDWALTILMAK